ALVRRVLVDSLRTAWVTGAGSGIGKEIAIRLAREGWRVAISARSVDDLETLAATSPGIFPFPLDVTDGDAVASTVTGIEAELGPIDLAVLSAGTYKPVSAKGFTASAYRTNVEVNLMGTVNCLEPLMSRMMSRRSGHIAV